MRRIVAIHQPNFFPWLGYFDKILKSDTFVFLDDVQFSKGERINRVTLKVSEKEKWITAPVDQNKGGSSKICDLNYNASIPWRKKIPKTLEANYRKCPFYDENIDLIVDLIQNPQSNIALYNIHGINSIYEYLELPKKEIIVSSNLNIQSSSTQRLVEIVKACGSATYLSGGGALGYQDSSLFEKENITLKFQEFDHPSYIQYDQDHFIKGLSIIDALMNIGKKGVKLLLEKGATLDAE